MSMMGDVKEDGDRRGRNMGEGEYVETRPHSLIF
jgi:hypothetical protein